MGIVSAWAVNRRFCGAGKKDEVRGFRGCGPVPAFFVGPASDSSHVAAVAQW